MRAQVRYACESKRRNDFPAILKKKRDVGLAGRLLRQIDEGQRRNQPKIFIGLMRDAGKCGQIAATAADMSEAGDFDRQGHQDQARP